MNTEWASGGEVCGVGFEMELSGQTHDYKHTHAHTCTCVSLEHLLPRTRKCSETDGTHQN